MTKQVTYKGKTYDVKITPMTQSIFLVVEGVGIKQVPDNADMSTIKKMIIEIIELPPQHLEAQFSRWDGNLDEPNNL